MVNVSLPTRAVIVALRAPVGGDLPNVAVARITGVPERTASSIYSRAISRGFNPSQLPLTLELSHIVDAPRAGRPSKRTERAIEAITGALQTDRYGREKTCQLIATELLQNCGIQLSEVTVWRVLRSAGYRKTKPTRKPGLTEAMKTARLEWCRRYEHWTIEDWKRVIFSDETSVVLGHRRGGYRIWRKSTERFVKSCIRPRWKGYSEFMFWVVSRTTRKAHAIFIVLRQRKRKNKLCLLLRK